MREQKLSSTSGAPLANTVRLPPSVLSLAMIDMRLRSEVNGTSATRVKRSVALSALVLRAATISDTSVGSPTISHLPLFSRRSPSFASVPATSVDSTSARTASLTSEPSTPTIWPTGA